MPGESCRNPLLPGADKEVIQTVGVKQRLTVAALAAGLGHPTPWPDFGWTTALNVAAYCASLNSILPGQRVGEQVEDTPETLYGSEGRGFESSERATSPQVTALTP
jgi:hypothetical protein